MITLRSAAGLGLVILQFGLAIGQSLEMAGEEEVSFNQN